MTNPRERLGLIADLSSAPTQHEPALVVRLTALFSTTTSVEVLERRDDVGAAYRRLSDVGCDVVALLGDGGSLAAAMSAALRMRESAPALLPLPLTLNARLRGRWTRRRDTPLSSLKRALKAASDGRGMKTELPTLRVSSALHPRALVGFDFLAGSGYRVLEESARARGWAAMGAVLEGAQAAIRLPGEPLEGTLNDAPAALSDIVWASAWKSEARPRGTFAFATGAFATGGGVHWRRAAMFAAALARQPHHKMAAARRLVVDLKDGFTLDGEIVALSGAGTVTVESGRGVTFYDAR